ncbi:MAG: hypothetical protein ABS70_04815 [Nitrospira sp. SCN 59-13]|nr:MAG: hypothetical protein ABS70_04815 [Nitrospira sp. SCN 59-13]
MVIGACRPLVRTFGVGALLWAFLCVPDTQANHRDPQPHADTAGPSVLGKGREIPGAPFHVYLGTGAVAGVSGLDAVDLDAAVQTVIDTFTIMLQHRADYPRFEESLAKQALKQVVIEPVVINDEGKAFPFLVARTKEPGRVILLISASSLKDTGYLNHPDALMPVLAREFQWVVSKADTTPKAKPVAVERNLQKAPILTDEEIAGLSVEERARLLQQLFDTYLRTVDDQKSLDGQSWYEVGNSMPISPTHADSTTKLYDIRIREALQKIVRDPAFLEQTPKAVRSLLNGKVWNVAYVKIDQRDWATRTRVLSEEKAVVVGKRERRIQPAAILVNVHRPAAADDPFYRETQGLPMGALSADQLAHVIALEIHHNIQEKSLSGHTAQDALTAPR